MKAIILEDEPLAAKRLKRLIQEIDPRINVLEVFPSIQSLVDHLTLNGFPDLLILDIHVADGNSFELFDLLEVQSKVIFTTAFDEYAVKAFRSNALDYLLKPIKKHELVDALSRARKVNKDEVNMATAHDPVSRSRFLLRAGSRWRLIHTKDIAYIVTENKLAYFVLSNGERFGSDHRLQDLENQLPAAQFFRVNRQFIVHHNAIKEILAYSKSRLKLVLSPAYDGEIVVSTDNTGRFKSWLEQ